MYGGEVMGGKKSVGVASLYKSEFRLLHPLRISCVGLKLFMDTASPLFYLSQINKSYHNTSK